MRLLLDTHVFLWWTGASHALSDRARQVIADDGDECFVSIASCWEMAIKASLGKLRLTQPVATFVAEQLRLNGFRLLPVELRHVAAVESLPFHHRDPFDRLLVVQARDEGLTFVTADSRLAEYGVSVLW